MIREVITVAVSSLAAIAVAVLITASSSYAESPAAQYSGDTLTTTAPFIVAQAKKKRKYTTPRRRGSNNFSGNGSGPQRLIPKGGCCQHVLNACATICNRAGGCTGNSDCATNPN